jgi:hypothetical protein
MLALAARTQQILSYAAFEGYTGIAIFVQIIKYIR